MSNTKPDSSQVKFIPAGAGAVPRTVQAKLLESVSVFDFGAVGDGVSDDTAAIQAAINSLAGGGTVLFSPGQYKITAQLSIVKSVVLRGAGPDNTMLVPVGGFNVLAYINAQEGAGAQSIGFAAAGHTSGYLIFVSGSDRTMFEAIIGLDPFNFMYIKKANACYISDTWVNNIRGTDGIYWYGDASNRSDVLDINNVQLSCGVTKSATGIKMNGAVHTLSVRHIGLVNMLRGLHIYNDTGGEDPQFATVSDMQVDFPQYEGVRIEGGFRTGLFSDVYVNGSVAGDGVYIGSGAQQFNFKGGKIAGNWKSGMALNGRYTDVIAVNVTNNSEAGSALYPGIEIGSTAISISVIGGTAGLWSGYAANKQSYGIVISAGAIEYRILGVTLTGNVTGDYLDTAHYFRSAIFGNIAGDASNVILKAPGTGALKLDNGNMFSNAGATSATIPNSPGSATPRRWMKVIGEDDVTYYVPCF